MKIKSPVFLLWISVVVNLSGQCIDGTPAAYPLNEQVSVHVIDPDCSFDPQWRKVLADPAVEGVGLIYHESTTRPSLALTKSNPISGLSVSVWNLNGKVSKAAVVTNASDVAGDFSAYVLTMEDGSCSVLRVGSAVTALDKSSVAGLVRKVLVGPKCVLHVVKPSSLRQLQAVQVPQGVSLVEAGEPLSWLNVRLMKSNQRADALSASFIKSGVQEPGLISPDQNDVKAAARRLGRIVFYRPRKLAGSAGDPLIRVDNVAIAKLDNGRYFSLNIPAGPHLIHAKWGFAKSDVTLDLQAGETVFLAFDAGIFRWTFLDPRQGRNDIRGLKPLDANKIIDKDRVEREIRLD